MKFHLLLPAIALAAAAAGASAETLYVRNQPSVPLLSSPTFGDEAATVKELPADEAVTVLGRAEGFVNVELADGAQGWLAETALTGAAPASARLAMLESEADELRKALAAAKSETARAQSRLRDAERRAEQSASSGADEVEALRAERQRLQQSLDAQTTELGELRQRLTDIETARASARLLAEQKTAARGAETPLPLRNTLWLVLAAAALMLASAWAGNHFSRRRLRRRYHGLEF